MFGADDSEKHLKALVSLQNKQLIMMDAIFERLIQIEKRMSSFDRYENLNTNPTEYDLSIEDNYFRCLRPQLRQRMIDFTMEYTGRYLRDGADPESHVRWSTGEEHKDNEQLAEEMKELRERLDKADE